MKHCLLFILFFISGIVMSQNTGYKIVKEEINLKQDTIIASDSLKTLVDSSMIFQKYNILEKLQIQSEKGGQVWIKSSTSVSAMLQNNIDNNFKKGSYTMYRIQILSISSLNADIHKLEEIRDKFEQDFPNIPAYLKYINPDFKIRVGNYNSRIECLPDMKRINKLYPNCYPVKTNATVMELRYLPLNKRIPGTNGYGVALEKDKNNDNK